MFELVKAIASLGTGIGAMNAVSRMIPKIPDTAPKAAKICDILGKAAVCGIVADAASEYIEKGFDKAKKMIDGAKEAVKAANDTEDETVEHETVKREDVYAETDNTEEDC